MANDYRVEAGNGRYHNPTEVCEKLETVARNIEGLSQDELFELDNEAYEVGMLFWSM